MSNPTPTWNARKIREAGTPTHGLKPLRDTKAYVKSLAQRERIPSTTMGHAFLRAL